MEPRILSSNLPLILAGPIVRRATPKKVWIWIATSQQLIKMPHLHIYKRGSAIAIEGESEWYHVALGKWLWVYMLAAMPAKPLEPGRIYEYDVRLDKVTSLISREELRHIVLPGFGRPSFVLGYQSSFEMRAIYASCRKLHGPNPDMMWSAEKILGESKPEHRPQYFFLGGDQIYADDVHPDFLTLTKPLRTALFGPVIEKIPGISPRLLHHVELERSESLKSFFSSSHMDHHLLTFAEYAITYLMAWNGGLWQFISPGKRIPTILKGGIKGAWHARRVLANIICYMIFDDHEVTDDWFINDEWEMKHRGHKTARRIITNGMAAYWAFQGWGNDPEAFDDDYRRTIWNYAEGLGYDTDGAFKLLTSTDWSFLTPTSPPVLVLDTRTRRERSREVHDEVGIRFLNQIQIQTRPTLISIPRNTEAPRLLGSQARARITKLISQKVRRNKPLIVVAPSPIFGFPPLEWVQSETGKVSASYADLESWSGNPRNTLDAIELLLESNPDPLIILSGDVHYGFEVVGNIVSKRKFVPFVQLCSSALKNEIVGGFQGTTFPILALFGRSTLAFSYWDFRKDGQSDGSISYAKQGTSGWKYFTEVYGSAPHVVHSQFIKRQGRETGRGRIEKKNNLGELIVSDSKVSHRHWYASKTKGVAARDIQTWDTSDWPIKSYLEELLKALGHVELRDKIF
ncbi:MAG: alkaline phosphatase D family protein [Nitrospirales bacterium]|nr:alkaline phosphatase D family protein [Nitrospirales bacterium]